MEEDGGARSKLGPGGGGADLISSLPEDLLLRVLVHLRCAHAAARTSVLSRRWRGLWTHLPKVTVTLRDVPLGSIEAALDRAARAGVYHYLLDIRVPGRLSDGIAAYGRAEYDARVSALLLATASLSPTEFRFTVPLNTRCSSIDVRLDDRFRRATSIKLHNLGGTVFPTDSALPALDRLSLSGCSVDLAALVLRCPRLRVLRVAATCFFDGNITVRSASLQELLVPSIVVESNSRWTSRIDIETPVLKELTLSFCTRGKPRVSVLAPVVENISWRCLYTGSDVGFSIWCLLGVSLRTAAERSDARGLLPGNGEDAYLHLPRGNVLSLHMYAQDSFSFRDTEVRFATELEKHMLTDFSGLELHLRAAGHMFGAIVLRLLAMHRVRTATRSLKIVLLRSEVKDFCHVNCICDEPQSWRTQTTSFTNLENVEIKGFEGEDHEFDFLKLIFRCTPMLKRLTVSLLDGATSSNGRSINKIYDIFKAYPFVECNVDLSSGSNADDIVHPGVEELYPEAEDPAGFGALDAPDEGGEPAYDDSYFVDEDYEL